MRALITLKFVETVARTGSIRRAAEQLAITSTALNRRILALEEELGYPLFERLPSGVRLNTAGEVFVDFIRRQSSDFERVKSQLADLAGVRRGHINIAATPEALKSFLPEQIAQYRKSFPQVTFAVNRCHNAEAEAALAALEADLAVTFGPINSPQFKVMAAAPQTLHVMMHEDHPLAEKPALRLRDLVGHPIMMPANESGLRRILDLSFVRSSLPLEIIGETDSLDFLHGYLRHENVLSVQIPLSGIASDLVMRPLDSRDVMAGVLHVGQLKDRVLPVASAKFLEQMVTALISRYPEAA